MANSLNLTAKVNSSTGHVHMWPVHTVMQQEQFCSRGLYVKLANPVQSRGKGETKMRPDQHTLKCVTETKGNQGSAAIRNLLRHDYLFKHTVLDEIQKPEEWEAKVEQVLMEC